MTIESVLQYVYARGWLRLVALLVSVSAHAAVVFWLFQPPSSESVPASLPQADVVYVTLPSEPVSLPDKAPPQTALVPKPS